MKRSEINALLDSAKELVEEHSIRLPPFAYWSTHDWSQKGEECDEIRDLMLGWDVTDFGSSEFDRINQQLCL